MDKALIITPFSPLKIGGAESFAYDLAKAIIRKYPIVHISTMKKQYIWQGMNYFKALKIIIPLLFATKKMLKNNQYAKVYALGLISSFICWLLRVKYSAIILALYDFKKPHFCGRFLNKAENVFVEGIRGKVDMIMAGVPKDKIIKFQHWVEPGKFTYILKNNNKMKVLFVGRPIAIKGKQVIQECEKITRDIEYEYIENVSHQDMPKYYQVADVVVVPSLYSEGFSKVVIEAASCGCALIVSNRGALPEMVGAFGKVIEPTPENFADELNKLRNNRVVLEKIQTATALYALNNFSVKNAEVFYETN